jgi:hypothetical protein
MLCNVRRLPTTVGAIAVALALSRRSGHLSVVEGSTPPPRKWVVGLDVRLFPATGRSY